MNPREDFEALARQPDEQIDLARAALLIAAEETPALAVEDYLARLDELAERATARIDAAASSEARVERFNRFLFEEEGFAGNRDEYDDPRNSFLNEVLDRRSGIPITLSVVYMEVGRRVGFDVRGIGFPGHFLALVVTPAERVVDPFFGITLSRDQCQERLAAVVGPDTRLEPALHLRPATPREILVRMLTNLKLLYARRTDYGRTLACCERITLLTPDAPLELRDRGLLYEKVECFAAAAADLSRFLELAPDDPSAASVRKRLRSLEARVRFH